MDKLSINDADAISLSQIDLDLCESSIRAQNGGNGDGAHQPNGEVETGHLGRSADSCYDAACGNYSVARSSGTGEEGALKRVCVRFFSASVIKNTPRIAISGSIAWR